MAGVLSYKDVRRIPKCPNHAVGCIIKTGTKNNATHGKSFYLCNNTKERCAFAEPASDIEATVCPVHQQMVELKAFATKQDGIRCYFRCMYGKELGSAWCGNELVKMVNKDAVVNPGEKLKDITNYAHTLKEKQKQIQKNVFNAYEGQQERVESHYFTDKWDVEQRIMSSQQSKQLQSDHQSHSSLQNSHVEESKVFHIPRDSCLSEGAVEHTIEHTTKLSEKNLADLDTSHSVFHIPRNARISDVSENSSMNSSASSNKSTTFVSNSTDKNSNSNTIEIISSDEEDEEKSGNTMEYHSSSNPAKNILHGTIESIELEIRKQTNLLQKIGPHAPDGGQKIRSNIDLLNSKLKEMKMHGHQKGLPQAPLKIALPSMAPPAPHSVINIGYDHPGSLYNLAQNRSAPLFGGRMTETRLKEVGRITNGAIEQLHKSLDTCPASAEEAEDPIGLCVTLMTHQRQAMAWLLWREKQIPSGGILADDMGLGKTLTMISLALKSKQDNTSKIQELESDSKLQFSRCTVVICPASLVHQWHKEIEKRVKKLQLRVCLYHGPGREKRVKRLAAHDIVLTTYNIVSIEGKPFVEKEKEKPKAGLSEWLDSTAPKKLEEGPLFKIFWRRIILDEGHNIKNHKTATSIAICALEGESRWIVTGTPIQNQTMDLYSLVKFLRVSPFDELKVWKREVDNKNASGTRRMNSIVNSILLRRTKDQTDSKTGKPIVSLPNRSCVLHKLELSKDEMAVYEVLQKFSKNMFTQFLDTRHGGHSTTSQPRRSSSDEMPTTVLGMDIDKALSVFGLRGVNAVNAGCLLVLVLRLRQCCGHLSLMCDALDSELCKTEGIDLPLDEQFGNLSIDADSPLFKESRPVQLQPTYKSTKISALLDCLREISKESTEGKSVIVSQWTRMLDTIAYHLKKEGFNFEFITGSVNAKKRSELVELFNTERNPQIMLVSLKAGGVGLNLIGGNNLFLLDQHWNPALEEQACDRIYRVGQKKDVVIHRFLCVNTVEERIVQLQEKKKSIANSVLYGGKSQKLTLDDLKTIFGLSR